MAAKTKKKPAKSKGKSSTLAPRTKKAEPEVATRHVYVFRNAGVKVNEDTALTLGAVFACVKVISEDIAGLPWRVHEKRAAGGSIELPDDPVDWLINTQASPETPAFQFREAIIGHVLTWGNGYAEIERDMAGRPAWLWLLTPDRVTPFRDDDKQVWYEVQNPVGEPTYLPAEDMFHLRGLGYDSLVGYSVIKLAARSIGAGIALDQSTSDLFANDSTPGGTLNHPGRLSKEARERLKGDWEKRHMGPLNRRRVAILEEGLKWEQTGLPPEDTKLIEQRQFTPADIARWFRVSPVKIQDLLRATFSNIEELAIWHVTDTLLPWARRLETEANIKLFGRTNRGRRFTKLNFHALLRGNTAAQTAHIKEMLGWGVYNVNEAKAYLDQNPIGPDGEKRFVPMNMQLLEKAGEEPPPPEVPPPDVDPDDDGDDDGDGPDDKPTPALSARPALMLSALRPVFEDACRRLLRAETERAKSAIKSGSEKAALWFEKMHDDYAGYVCGHLRPCVSALALARGASPELIDAALGVLAGRHVEAFGIRLARAAAEPTVTPLWEAGANELAAKVMRQIDAACGMASVSESESEPSPSPIVVNAPVTIHMPEQKPVFNLTMPEQKPHVVNNVVNVPDQAAPNVTVNVPAQLAPVVNVPESVVHVAAPVVHVAAPSPPVVNNVVNVPEQLAPVVNVSVPEQVPPTVMIDNRVEVPQQASPNVVVNVPEQAVPSVTVNVPEQASPNITVNVPEQKPADVRIENKVEVPAQAAPSVTVNVPEQPPASVTVTIPDQEFDVTLERDTLGRATGLKKRLKPKGK